MKLTRRHFFGASAASLLASGRMKGAQESESSKLARLACNSWPFRGYFDTPEMHEYRNPKYPLLTQAEFPEFLADHFQIHNVEFLPQHFAETDPAAVVKVKAGLKKAHSRCCNLMGVELPGGVFTPGADRAALAKEAKRWAGVAAALGAPSITIALTGEGPVDAGTVAGNLAPAVEAVHRQGIAVLFHNDDVRRESAETLVSVIQQLGRDRVGACPDFGNFATKSAAFALSQLRLLVPYASAICHSKDGIAQQGKFYPDDFGASMAVMHGASFRGVYSLEFEGLGDPLEGVRQLQALTERYLS